MATASWMPADEDLRPRAEALAAVAGAAPSLHNAQPWPFRVGHDHVDVLLDRSRLLPVADPKTRQAHLGLGAAVFLLRLQLSTMDCAVEVEPWPDSGRAGSRRAAGRRWPARRHRRGPATARRGAGPPDRSHPVHRRTTCRSALQVAWREQAEAEGAGLRWVEAPGERVGVAALVAAAERLQQRDPAYLAELDRWTSTGRSTRAPACRRQAFGVTAAAGHAAEFPLRDFAGGTRHDRAPARRPARAAPGRDRAAHRRPTGPRTGCAAARR